MSPLVCSPSLHSSRAGALKQLHGELESTRRPAGPPSDSEMCRRPSRTRRRSSRPPSGSGSRAARAAPRPSLRARPHACSALRPSPGAPAAERRLARMRADARHPGHARTARWSRTRRTVSSWGACVCAWSRRALAVCRHVVGNLCVIFHYNHQSVTCVLIQHVSNAHRSTVARHLTHQGSSNSLFRRFRGASPRARRRSHPAFIRDLCYLRCSKAKCKLYVSLRTQYCTRRVFYKYK